MSANTAVWSARNVSKAFGPTKALSDASVSIRAGEIHGLIGENGAGKSTITKVAVGVHHADSGTFTLNGADYQPKSLTQTAEIGVSLIFQEITVNPMLTVAENVYISKLWKYRRAGLLDTRTLNRKAQEHLERLGADFSVRDDVGSLNLGQLKIIELARAIAEEPTILFVDEATAVLDARGKELIINALRSLVGQGLAIGYVSHHFDEIFSLTDRVTIMRNGSNVATLETSQTNRAEIESLMVGRAVADKMFPTKATPTARKTVLAAERVTLDNRVLDASFEVGRGEVLGIAGLAGSGGAALLRVLAGDLPMTSGVIELESAPYKPRSPKEAMARKVAYLPGDRDLEGLVGNFSVRENIALAAQRPSFAPVRRREEREMVTGLVHELRIKAESSEIHVDSLSGGNRQKVVLAKLLAIKPHVLLLDNPTRGVDVGAREHLYAAIAQAAEQGMSVLLLSEDLGELLGLSHRLMVFRNGKISHHFDALDGIVERDVISHML
ncbi:MAG: sugar ABC transporter ATP-binding protein [Mycobacterium sp.]